MGFAEDGVVGFVGGDLVEVVGFLVDRGVQVVERAVCLVDGDVVGLGGDYRATVVALDGLRVASVRLLKARRNPPTKLLSRGA